ncbi:MAG: glycosyltransferase family 39 protein, partial [Deltaproteobacteria bacterium]|nr:glycosyltransferase family 39 protein [Deltaproteobacteria bacterium]
MSRRPALQAVLLALLLVLPHLLFLAVDQRPPNDHDTWYTKGVADSWTNAQLAPDAVGKVKAVAEHFLFEGWHPQLAQTLMLAAMVLLGPSLLVFRGINLLFWALLVGSTYAVGRQLRSHRLGLVAMTLVAWMPGMLAYARKWEPMFHGSAFSAFAWALALRCLAPDAARLRWPWLALGCALGARFYTHPTGLPDLGLTLALTPLFAFVLARRRGEALGPLLRRAAMLGGTTLALGAWYLGLLPVVAQEPSYKLEYYLGWRASYVGGGEGDLLQRQVQGLRKLSNALWHWHWHPVMALALGFPGLLAAGRQIARVPVTGAGLLGAIFLLQLPLVQITFANGAVTPDWLHLMPLAIILAAFGLSALVDVGGRLGQGGRALLVVSLGYAALSAVGPQVVSLAGPDPLLDSRAYR